MKTKFSACNFKSFILKNYEISDGRKKMLYKTLFHPFILMENCFDEE